MGIRILKNIEYSINVTKRELLFKKFIIKLMHVYLENDNEIKKGLILNAMIVNKSK